MLEHIITKEILDSAITLDRVEIDTNEIHVYQFELANNNDSITKIDVPSIRARRPDWTIHFWISEGTPFGKAIIQNFAVTHRTNYSLVVNGQDIEIHARNAKVLTLFTRRPDKTYYLNIQNREGHDGFYSIEITNSPEYLTDHLSNYISDSDGNYILVNT